MGKMIKFATQVDEKVLKDLKAFAQENHKNISGIVSDALNDYLKKVKIRPAFLKAIDAVLDENDELLRRLAK